MNIPTQPPRKNKPKTGANANADAKASRARRGDLYITALILAAIGIVIGAIIYLFVLGGISRVLGNTGIPAITANEMGGVITVNIKDTGVGNVAINAITLYTGTNQATCNSATYYLNGNPAGPPPITIKPGQTYTAIYTNCNPPASEVTGVAVITSTGTYTAAVT